METQVNCIELNLSSIGSIVDLLGAIRGYNCLKSGDTLNLKINTSGRIKPQYLCIIVSWIKYLESKGVILEKEIEGENTYASRIDFYKHIGYKYEESFNRHNARGRFVEITNTNRDNTNDIVNLIMDVIDKNMKVDETLFQCLSYFLFEVIDNINEHSESPIGGHVVVQNFEQQNLLSIAIVDSGVGIHKSLKDSGKPEFLNIDEQEALKVCLEEGVTRFKERGYGLYHTSKFIKANKGKMEIYSGDSTLHINNGNQITTECNSWQGVIMYFEIKTDNNVDFIKVFDSKDRIPVSVTEARDVLNGYMDDYL